MVFNVSENSPLLHCIARSDQSSNCHQLGTTIAAHEELSKILSDTDSVISALRCVKEDVRRVRKDVAQTKSIAQDTRRHIALLGGNLQKVAVDVRHGLDGLATTEDVRRIEIQMQRIESRLMVETPFKAGLNTKARTVKGRETAAHGMQLCYWNLTRNIPRRLRPNRSPYPHSVGRFFGLSE